MVNKNTCENRSKEYFSLIEYVEKRLEGNGLIHLNIISNMRKQRIFDYIITIIIVLFFKYMV